MNCILIVTKFIQIIIKTLHPHKLHSHRNESYTQHTHINRPTYTHLSKIDHIQDFIMKSLGEIDVL